MDNQMQEAGNRQVTKSKKNIIILIILMLLICATIGVTIFMFLYQPTAEEDPYSDEPNNSIISQNGENVNSSDKENNTKSYYSPLTGLEVADEAATKAATFCMQIPNGTDGARPQAGLNRAGVIFEAIAERGITRFAAIFQGVDEIPAMGPMRSLRIYYLDWDVPFDCTIVHDGGSYEATVAARSYKDFTNFGYHVWRDYGRYGERGCNSEFTSGQYLLSYNSDSGYASTSNVTGFTRETPAKSAKTKIDAQSTNPLDIDQGTDASTSELKLQATTINLVYGGSSDYDPVYHYDATSNTYLRSYADGSPMLTQDCTGLSGEPAIDTACSSVQVAPAVVIAMVVEEHVAEDNYHEDIKSIGEGTVHIFQNGLHYEGIWRKSSREDQIHFFDAAGTEIPLAPGQTIVSAVPQYGSIAWE